jgi:hypothetical protein
VEIAAYVGSLVGGTMSVDMTTLHRDDYARIKIVAKDVSKITETVEGVVIPCMFDFHFEKEV